MRSETSFLDVSRLQDVAATTTPAAARNHRAGRSALALGIRFDAEWLLKHFMIAQAINCPRKRVNSKQTGITGALFAQELWSNLVYADEIKRRPGWDVRSLLH